MNLGARVSPASKQCINGLDEPINTLRELVDSVLKFREKSLASRPVLHPLEESVFVRMGDYWIVRYQGQPAILKATRGLDYLAYLLRHPGREVHVRELIGTAIDLATPASCGSSPAASRDVITARLRYGVPLLDSQAKLEYKRRIDELRKDVQEAERSNDSYRAGTARHEIDTIAERLAAAVGLGGRDRRASSDAERARSAVTMRIKKDIKRTAEVLPLLGRHLAARIKTGYLCSYNPHPERPVNWNVRTASRAICDARTYNVTPKATLKTVTHGRTKSAATTTGNRK
jgi:hypothetical protein